MDLNGKLIRRALEKISEFGKPLVILIDAMDEISSDSDNLEGRLWEEFYALFGFVRRTALYSLEDDIRDFLGRPMNSGPLVLRMEPDDFFQQVAMEVLLERISYAGIKDVVVLCLIGADRPSYEGWVLSYINRKQAEGVGITVTPIVITDNTK